MAGAGNSPAGRRDAPPLPNIASGLPRLFAASERGIAVAGVLAFLAGTIPDLAPHVSVGLTIACVTIALMFGLQYAIALRAAPNRLEWMTGGHAIIDLLAALPVPLALLAGAPGETARLFGVFWALKLIRMNAAFAMLGRVLRNERQPLVSVTAAFIVVMLFAATLGFVLEHNQQPESFGSVPAALWWAITTITTTGYGDKIPATFVGRMLAGALMVSGIALFALWAGILASGFAQELRRRDFLESWDLVVRLPLFRNLGAPALAEIARLLKVETFSKDAVIVRTGEPGDSMYFIADGEAHVHMQEGTVRLTPGQFFGEMALVTGEPRIATVVAIAPCRLLRLDVVEFRGLARRLPDLLQIIESEAVRRGSGTIP